MAVPTLVSATIAANGTTLTLVWSEAVGSSTATATISIAGRLASITATYTSGNGTATTVLTLASTVYLDEVCTVAVPAGAVTSVSTSSTNQAISGAAVTNSSTQTLGAACTGKAARMMRNRCMVLRRSTTQSGSSGGPVVTWAPVYTGLCCSIQAGGSSENTGAGQEQDAASYSGFFPTSVTLKHHDRLCMVTGGGIVGLSNKILELAGRPIDHGAQGAYLFAPLEEVKGNG